MTASEAKKKEEMEKAKIRAAMQRKFPGIGKAHAIANALKG